MYDYLAKIILLGPSGSGKSVDSEGHRRSQGLQYLGHVCFIDS